MRVEEAEWIGKSLSSMGVLGTVLELGSSTLSFRMTEKPHIDRYIHEPLRRKGVRVVHSDIKSGDGIDINGDIYDPEILQKLTAVEADVILCCNIFEHVSDRQGFAEIIDKMLKQGGKLIVSVPYSYPYHLDPIDTRFRPSPSEIKLLFPRYVMSAETIVSGDNYLHERGLSGVLTDIAKSVLLRRGIEATKARLHRLAWLFRPYKISIAVFTKSVA